MAFSGLLGSIPVLFAIAANAAALVPGRGTAPLGPTTRAVYMPAARLWAGVTPDAVRALAGDLLGIPSGVRLEFRSLTSSPIGKHFLFAQTVDGIPVFGAEMRAHVAASGEILGLTSSVVAGISGPSRVAQTAVTAAEAQSAVRRFLGGSVAGEAHSATLYYHLSSETDEARLVWEVRRLSNGPSWRALVDAHSGRLVGTPDDLNHYERGTGRVFHPNPIVATRDTGLRDHSDSASAVPATAYALVDLLGLSGHGYLDGQFASGSRTKKRAFSRDNSFLFDRRAGAFNEVMAYYHIDLAQRHIQSLGFGGVNNRVQVFGVDRYKADNSYYTETGRYIEFGTGGVDDAEDAEVIWHEYGHAIQDDQVTGFGADPETAAMGEGFGDYWAGSLGSRVSGGFQDDCIAEWDSSTSGACLRRLDSDKHYPESMVNEPHDDGEMWSASLWRIARVLGQDRADRLILQHHFLLAKNATFNQACDAMVTSAIHLGFSSGEVAAIKSILRERGFTVTAAGF